MPPAMPPATAALQTSPTPEEALSALLTLGQLTELIALVSAITDSMHAQLSDAFNTSLPSTTTPAQEPLQQNAASPDRAAARVGHAETEAEARAGRVQARREQELPEDGLTHLKSDVLEWFQRWRDGVVGMVVDALNAKGRSADGLQGAQSDAAALPDYEIFDPHPPSTTTAAAAAAAAAPSLTTLYPPTATPLSCLPRATRTALLSATLLLVLSKGHYAAPARVLLLHMLSALRLPRHVLQADERRLARGLLEAAQRMTMSAAAETQKRSAENASRRRWQVGLAGVAGAALIGVTGGLAAPLVAGAIGSVMGGLGLGATAAAGLLGTLGSSGVLVGGLFGAYGYGMTSKMMDQYAKDVEDFAFLPMRKSGARGAASDATDVPDVPADERRLSVTIGVSGWLTERRDIVNPWRVLGIESEVFALRWELEALLDMGKSLESMVSSAVWAVATREIVARTVFASLMFAMWPIAFLKLSKLVDNPFNVAKSRADKAGLVLADAIINKAQGERPVTLIGYSMGARLIYSCLMSLAERRAFGLVESAVLIGAPAPSDASVWRAVRSVVSGRLVNVYSEKDYVLAFLYRTSSIQFGVAGLEAVGGVRGVENVDVSATVSGHLRYPHLVGAILEKIGWEDINMQEVEREQYIAEMLDKEERERTAQRNDKTPVRTGESTTQTDVQTDDKESRPALPSRPQIGTSGDPLGAGAGLSSMKDVRIEEALAATLTRYVEQEAAQRFRCRILECQRLFTAERFWRKHVAIKHTKWLEGIKHELRSTTSKGDIPESQDHSIPILQDRATPKYEDEDLMSFDEAPKEVRATDEKTNIPERPIQQSFMDMPEEQHETLKTHNDRHKHEADVSDAEMSHGITMVDNEEDKIAMLEPVPWTEDEDPQSH